MKKKVMTQKLRLVTSEFPIPPPHLPPPPPPSHLKSPKSLPKILIILSEFYCGRPAYKSPLNFFPRSAPVEYTMVSLNMHSFSSEIGSRSYHVYKKTTWTSIALHQPVTVMKETNDASIQIDHDLLGIDPYCWKT